MEWEKQDNELRRLMEGSSFLPDNEKWDAKQGWEKLNQRRRPAKSYRAKIWLRWSAAACVIGILGFGFWWMLQGNPRTVGGKVIVRSKNEPQPVSNAVSPKSEDAGFQEKGITFRQMELAGGIPGSAAPKRHEKVAGKMQKSQGSEELKLAPILPDNGEITAKTSQIKVEKTSETVITGTSPVMNTENAGQSLAVVPAPVKKKPLRVVHYNELVGSGSMAPPVFVKTRKAAYEWESLALQSSASRKDPSLQLKIDISPIPKKAL